MSPTFPPLGPLQVHPVSGRAFSTEERVYYCFEVLLAELEFEGRHRGLAQRIASVLNAFLVSLANQCFAGCCCPMYSLLKAGPLHASILIAKGLRPAADFSWSNDSDLKTSTSGAMWLRPLATRSRSQRARKAAW